MRELTVECSYEPCNCTISAPVGGAEPYCGETCSAAEQEGLESGFCSCGHSQCDEP